MRLLGLLLALVAFDAQATTPVTPAIVGVVKAGTPIQVLGEGFAGTEGPVALPDGSLLFTENRAARATRVALDGSAKVFLTNPAGPNALALNSQGSLVAVLTAQPGVQIFGAAGKALGVIELPKRPQNLAFAGKNKHDLFVVGQGTVYRVHTRTQGVLARAK